MKYVIIGAGAAGVSCARHLKRFSDARDITVVSRESTQPYSRMLLPYILSGALSFKDAQITLPKGVSYMKGSRIVRIDADNKFVITEKAKKMHFDKLLIASGSVPYIRPVDGIRECNRWTCVKDIDDIEKIKYFIKHTRSSNVILAGAGLVNMEIGEALRVHGMNLIYIVSSDRLLSSIVDIPGSRLIEGHLQNKGVRVIKGQSVKSIECSLNAVKATLTNGADIEGCCVVFGKGVVPNVDFLSGSGILSEPGIPVNEYLCTNKKDIFAAGDVAMAIDPISGKKGLHPIRPAAVMQGKIAAYNMQELSFKYTGEVMSNILTVGEKTIFTAGNSRAESPYTKMLDGNYAKAVIKDGVLDGILFIGDNVKNPGIYIELIKKRVSVKSMISPILTDSLNYDYVRYYTKSVV